MSLAPRLLAGFIIPGLLLSVGGCGFGDRIRGYFQDDSRNKVALQVGDKVYTRADLNHYFDSRLSEFRDPADADKIKSNLLESFIEDKLLLHEARSHKIQADAQLLKTMMESVTSGEERAGPPDPGKEAELKQDMTESLQMQQYIRDHLLKDISITDEQCEVFYQAHFSDFVRNDVAHVREILVEDLAQAQKILDSLAKKRNKNFGELARVYSKAPSASEGGDLGTFQRGDLPEEFEKAIFPLSPGTISKIVRTKYGYHIFLVEEKIAAHQQKFWEVKNQIRERLQQEKERDLINRELTSLQARIQVKIQRDNLDFNYIGTRFPTN